MFNCPKKGAHITFDKTGGKMTEIPRGSAFQQLSSGKSAQNPPQITHRLKTGGKMHFFPRGIIPPRKNVPPGATNPGQKRKGNRFQLPNPNINEFCYFEMPCLGYGLHYLQTAVCNNGGASE